eukprot:CAMPEP_0194664138 /NCGR_PEP_ID=MMETSP0295-20121207/1268_1 /TAXON_ID=39354 /ORGANISM="Heterosigma akashiwo, Strain CCMP2393" /LENGTH=59 /DNA_ID=CAMNT_0039545793 /DNA_START=431 /DNA_END=607 /DNA_ORIENTATION=-
MTCDEYKQQSPPGECQYSCAPPQLRIYYKAEVLARCRKEATGPTGNTAVTSLGYYPFCW